jgi:LmbE family N-acetylglucosaminyl deacetylase
MYLFWSNYSNTWIDVSATIDRKVAALREHPSQIQEPEKLDDRIREWAAELGQLIGTKAAERFRLIVIDEEDETPSELTPQPVEDEAS